MKTIMVQILTTFYHIFRKLTINKIMIVQILLH